MTLSQTILSFKINREKHLVLLPDFLARPIFHVVYIFNRRQDGATFPPIRRRLKPVPAEQQLAFDQMIDAALANGHNSLTDYSLPYPKADFLNYLCDWRGFGDGGVRTHAIIPKFGLT